MKALNGLSATRFLPVEKAAPSLSGRGPMVVTGVVSLLVVLSLIPAVVSAQVVWTQAASSKPSERQPGALAFDSKRGVMVSFGGWNGDTLGDTWEWNGARWKRVSHAGPPPPHP